MHLWSGLFEIHRNFPVFRIYNQLCNLDRVSTNLVSSSMNDNDPAFLKSGMWRKKLNIVQVLSDNSLPEFGVFFHE